MHIGLMREKMDAEYESVAGKCKTLTALLLNILPANLPRRTALPMQIPTCYDHPTIGVERQEIHPILLCQ